jgi:multidrug efflux system membrane fusion protein
MGRGKKSEIWAVALVGGVLAFTGCGKQETKKGAPPAPKVVTMVPEAREVLEYEDLPGRIDAIEDVEIKARVTGYLNKVEFQEGAEVKKGDLLFSIDPREYQAEMDSANAALQQAQAKYLQSQSDFERAKQLSKSTVIAKQELETQGTAVLEAAAGVRAAQAALAKAQLNLDYTQIRAPIDGKISSTNITVGNLVAVGDTLTSIVLQSPVYVYFEAPERAVLRWDKAMKDASGQGLTTRVQAHVGLLNETGFPREARVDFSDNELNAGTGTLRLRAVLENDDRRLRVGLYARVRVSLDKPRNSLLVPERAVGVDQGQRFVYVVNSENKIEYRKVTVGQIYDGLLSITEGLNPEDRVVTEGLLALRPGLVVQPEDKVASAK